MRVVFGILLSMAIFAALGTAQAQTQVNGVNIVYPIHGATYPITDPGPGKLRSAYFTSSFSVTCGGGQHTVKWGFDGATNVGSETFYDQTSVQFVHKLPGGTHSFDVVADCGQVRRGGVKFNIGQ